MQIAFTKVEAIGNHFVLVNAVSMPEADWDRIFADARMRLNGLGTGVSNASTRMAETDQRVGRSFAT